MHVPEKHLELYRAIAVLARKADSVANAYSGKGQYADANRVWSVAGDLRAAANRLREPGQKEGESDRASADTGPHERSGGHTD